MEKDNTKNNSWGVTVLNNDTKPDFSYVEELKGTVLLNPSQENIEQTSQTDINSDIANENNIINGSNNIDNNENSESSTDNINKTNDLVDDNKKDENTEFESSSEHKKEEENKIEQEIEVDEEEIEVAQFFGTYLKSKGILGEDFKLENENMTVDSVINALREKESKQIEANIDSKYQQLLASAGVNEQNISLLQAIENGTPIDEIYVIDRFKKYSNIDIYEADENFTDKMLQDYYKQRGFLEDEIDDRMLIIDSDDKKRESELEKAKKHFSEKIEIFNEEQSKQTALREEQIQKEKEYNFKILDKALVKGELKNEKLSPMEVEKLKTFFNDKKIFKIEGKDVELTEFENWYYNLSNFENLLYLFKIDKFRSLEKEQLKTQITNEENEELRMAMAKIHNRSQGFKSIKKRNSKNSDTAYVPKKAGRYEIDLS